MFDNSFKSSHVLWVHSYNNKSNIKLIINQYNSENTNMFQIKYNGHVKLPGQHQIFPNQKTY